MNKTRNLIGVAALLALMSACSENPKFKYETVPNDPMQTRIYTLDNGLKVYLTVNKETPRIQTYIAVRVGGKNDPAETTGLAHYFEHLMFKGTEKFGTTNFSLEKPMLDEIEKQFEVYRVTTDEQERKAIYHKIDSISYEASKIAIPNEYDKLMAAIGAQGTNAYTGFDQTVYVEDIPSNEIDNWAKIQADRFENATIRGFHTELETVYEEKNMSLTNDFRKTYEAILNALFPDYPYGTQTVLGSQEHLKNPSITNIKNYFKTWYVPNNMAICMSGDLNPDETIEIINKYFSALKPNPNLPERPQPKESPITEPVIKEVVGLDAENVALAWRMPTTIDDDIISSLVGSILYNGQAGLLDVDLNQQQKVLSCFAGSLGLSDYNTFMISGKPKQGQTLDDVKDLFLKEVEKLRNGDFDEDLLQATVNNYKLYFMNSLESNESRADMFVSAFIDGDKWSDVVTTLDKMSKVTKQQVVDFANKYMGNNYALVYKRQGKDPDEKKIDKPSITPIVMNRDSVSPFLKEIQTAKVTPIEPVFLDFSKDMQKFTAKSDIEVLYKKNELNDIFQMIYIFDMGNANDKALGTAFSYMEYLGTSKKTLAEINKEFYRLACSFTVHPGLDRTYVVLAGLQENMPKAMELFEEILSDAQVDKDAYKSYAADILKKRQDSKLNQSSNFSQLVSYAMWGPQSPSKNILSEQELLNMNPQELVDRIHKFNSYKHRIMYYGPAGQDEVTSLIDKYHKVPEQLAGVPAPAYDYKYQPTTENKILFAEYEAKQIYFTGISNLEKQYDAAVQPTLSMYNEYFSGGMNSIVFQEMREARSLAYSAYAYIASPSKVKYPYIFRSFIATQNDKMIDAMKAFDEIINNMPESEKAFKLAQEATISRLRTDRITGMNVLWEYIDLEDRGLKEDTRKALFEKAQTLTLKDIKDFQQNWVKDRKYTFCILGKEKDLDMKSLEKYGKITKLSQKDIFGY